MLQMHSRKTANKDMHALCIAWQYTVFYTSCLLECVLSKTGTARALLYRCARRHTMHLTFCSMSERALHMHVHNTVTHTEDFVQNSSSIAATATAPAANIHTLHQHREPRISHEHKKCLTYLTDEVLFDCCLLVCVFVCICGFVQALVRFVYMYMHTRVGLLLLFLL